MGRRNIVSERIIKILDSGKLLRFSDILNEYERLYDVKAFQSISRNLKILQSKGIVSQIVGHFCLTKDLAGKITGEQIELAIKRTQKLRRAEERINKATRAELDAKFKQLIARNDSEEMERTIEQLEESNRLLALALQVEMPLYTEWDRDRIRQLIFQGQKQIEQLKKILGGRKNE